jgi:hypothetical protein
VRLSCSEFCAHRKDACENRLTTQVGGGRVYNKGERRGGGKEQRWVSAKEEDWGSSSVQNEGDGEMAPAKEG